MVVWVANREKSVKSTGELASLRIGTDGNLRLVDGQQNMIWATNITVNSNHSYAELLDDGNLVLKYTGFGTTIAWASFDHPCDTFLPGMKVGINVLTGDKRYLVSWTSETDPSPGNFVYGLTLEIPTQAIGWMRSRRFWRGGYWDKAKFIGVDMDGSYSSMFSLQQDPKQGTYLLMTENPDMPFSTMFITPNGTLKLVVWYSAMKEWVIDTQEPSNLCESYGACGPFGICKAFSSPICSCLTSFAPKSKKEWNKGNWTGGCIRQTTLNCQRSTNTSSSNDTFLNMSNMNLPDFANFIPYTMDGHECQSMCLVNCSCQAYFYKPNIGCLIWTELQRINLWKMRWEI